MWGTLMDSVQTDLQGDTVFYNYPIVRDTALRRDAESAYAQRCVWVDAPNWNGGKVLISSGSGSTYLFRELDTLVIRHTATVGEAWPMYHYEDESRLMAQVVSIALVDDDWVVDSVKTIVLNRYDMADNVIEDPMNGKTISLYQNNGIRSAFDMHYFPFDTVAIKRVDPNVINANSSYLNRPVPMVGDILTECSSSSTESTPFGSSYCVSTIVNSVQQIDFQTYLISATRNARQSNTTLQYNPDPAVVTTVSETSVEIEYTYSTYLDSVIPFVCIWEAMPLQQGTPYNYMFDDTWGGCLLPKVELNGCNQLYYEEYNVGLQCHIGFIPFECFGTGTTVYGAYIGVISSRYDDFDGGWPYTIHQSGIPYMSNANNTCGNYVVVGMEEEPTRPAFSIALSPNPTTGMVQLTIAEGEVAKGMTARVYSATGQLVREDIGIVAHSTSIDLSAVPNGIYLIVITDGRHLSSTKVVKQ